MIQGNLRFVDSKAVPGVQAAASPVSGIRRCLRRQFANNEAVATGLGNLMLQARHNAPSLNFVSFGDEVPLDKATADVVRLMSTKSKRMVKVAGVDSVFVVKGILTDVVGKVFDVLALQSRYGRAYASQGFSTASLALRQLWLG